MISMSANLRRDNLFRSLFVGLFVVIFFVPSLTFAQAPADPNFVGPPAPAPANPNAQKDKAPAQVKGIADLDPIKTDPEQLIGRLIKSALGIIGTIALIIMIYAGVTWMLAGVRGSTTDIKKAQDTIFWGVLG